MSPIHPQFCAAAQHVHHPAAFKTICAGAAVRTAHATAAITAADRFLGRAAVCAHTCDFCGCHATPEAVWRARTRR